MALGLPGALLGQYVELMHPKSLSALMHGEDGALLSGDGLEHRSRGGPLTGAGGRRATPVPPSAVPPTNISGRDIGAVIKLAKIHGGVIEGAKVVSRRTRRVAPGEGWHRDLAQ